MRSWDKKKVKIKIHLKKLAIKVFYKHVVFYCRFMLRNVLDISHLCSWRSYSHWHLPQVSTLRLLFLFKHIFHLAHWTHWKLLTCNNHGMLLAFNNNKFTFFLLNFSMLTSFLLWLLQHLLFFALTYFNKITTLTWIWLNGIFLHLKKLAWELRTALFGFGSFFMPDSKILFFIIQFLIENAT